VVLAANTLTDCQYDTGQPVCGFSTWQ
jgi:hypothetical protein